MNTHIYLIMNQRGSVRTTKGRPNIKAGEIAVRLEIQVDDQHFRMPTAIAFLDVGEAHVIQPTVEIEPVEGDDEGDDEGDGD